MSRKFAPTLALQTQTASSGYSFTPATGAFTYTPPAGDVGTQTFTFTAANAAGTVTQITSVVVSEVPTAPDAPASVWASATNAAGFTAAWSASAGATSYRLDVGTNETFSAGGGSVNLMSNAGFESGDSTSWTKFETEYAVATTDPQEGTYHVAITASGTRDLMQPVAITGDGVTEYEVSFWYKKPASGNCRIWATWASGGQVSGDNLTPDAYLPVASDWTKMTYYVVPQSGANTLNFEVRTYSGATVSWDNFFVGAAGGGSTPSYVSGYSNRTVSGTSESVTGLASESTYYFRVRAVNDVGTSGDSSVASVTTSDSGPSPQTITFPAIATQIETNVLELSATASSGLPVGFAVGAGPAIADGTVDCITTDHAPHAEREKYPRGKGIIPDDGSLVDGKAFSEAPNGIIGLQTSFALGMTFLVEAGHITLERLIELMSVNPAGIIGREASLRAGADADIVVFSPDENFVLSRSLLRSKSSNTPFMGLPLRGAVRNLVVGGRRVI